MASAMSKHQMEPSHASVTLATGDSDVNTQILTNARKPLNNVTIVGHACIDKEVQILLTMCSANVTNLKSIAGYHTVKLGEFLTTAMVTLVSTVVPVH